jgi:endonuclease/exonuclease/phosphatase (EEP) superfamily protein YafD
MLLAILLVLGSPQWAQRSVWQAILTVSIAILYLPPVYLLLPVTVKLYVLASALTIFALTTLFVASPVGQSPFADNRDAGFVRFDTNNETLRVGKNDKS